MNRWPKWAFSLLFLAGIADAKSQVGTDPLLGVFTDASTSQAVSIVLALTLVALLPGIFVAMTAFTRIVIVLSMLRHALGMQETPPNVVLVALAAFLTLLSMTATFDKLEQQVATPLYQQQIDTATALKRTSSVMKDYMITKTRETDIAFVLSLSGKTLPTEVDTLGLAHVVPAFLLSELRLAFQIGFVIFLPFLLVDLIVSGILMSLGMMMVPPVTIALPIKILMFVLIDGWTLIARAVLADSL